MDNRSPDAVFIAGKYISPDTWYDSTGAPFQPQVSIRAARTGSPLGNMQMIGKSNAGAMKGEEPKLTELHPRCASTTWPGIPWTDG